MHLLFTAAATAYSNAAFGQGSGPILMDNVACTGLESGLINCTFDNHTSDCVHSEDAGVRCYSPPSTGKFKHRLDCQLIICIDSRNYTWP